MVLERVVRARHASGGVDFGVSDRASVGGLFCFGKGRGRLSKMQIFKQLFSCFFLWVVNDILSVKNFFVRVSLSVTIYYYGAHLQRVARYGLFLVVYSFVVSDG